MDANLQIMNWEVFSHTFLLKKNIDEYLHTLEEVIIHRSYLVDDILSDADKYVFFRLTTNKRFMAQLREEKISSHLTRYYHHLEAIDEVRQFVDPHEMDTTAFIKKERKCKISESNTRFEDGGIFIDLMGAEKGTVVVRFPPEASGFLHIGHAKAALINQYYKNHYNGQLLLRFDDTNPAKETVEFENAILDDLKRLGISFDKLSYTSDHFETLMGYCEKLLNEGHAYVDDTDLEIMRKEREACKESRCRNNSVEDNVLMWQEMIKGSETGVKCCVRVRLDMASHNGCMRDPTIYRCKPEKHVRTGDKYKVYPIYDFACPIVDSIEGVTHSLRTSEYNDRNEQFYAILDLLGLRKPHITDYSRLSLQNTLLSKRRLTWIVNEGYVEGWDDPRMPTIRGILRHGMTVEGLKEFIIAQGFGRSNVVMEWDKIWAFNKMVIENVVPRFMGLSAAAGDLITVRVSGQVDVCHGLVARHPKNESVGTKDIWFTPRVMVERSDANDFVEGDNVTFINWGNLRIDCITRDVNGSVVSVDASLNLGDKDFKKTLKVTWLPLRDDGGSLTIPISVITYGPLITKNVLGKNDDFKKFVSTDSKNEQCFIGDLELRTLRRGDIIQLQRKGFFICDEEYREKSQNADVEYPLVLIYIPEGNKKERPTTGVKKKLGVAKGIEKMSIEDSKDAQSDQKRKQTRLGMEAVKEDNISEWYTQVITKSELLDYYDISGCYILLPTSYDIWERIQAFFDREIKLKGVRNCYFPMFISEGCLMKEKEHIADFSPEVAWVTMCGDKKLEKPVAIRPTSETAMYPYFAKCIQSYRDLPLKLNQWCNVVRWEFKDPVPFLRTREFLWQEGHTAYGNREDAVKEVHEILDLYTKVYVDLLAIPVVKGRKTEKEKFAGADFTTTAEIYVSASGRAIQGATSHHLGQNFSRMFEVRFESACGVQEYVHQNSWGLTTRTIGILVMVHGDNKGLVLPPRVAVIQVVIVPCGITVHTSDQEKVTLAHKCREVCDRLVAVGCRAHADLDEHRSPGWKFNHWELKGVPIRLEIGPRDMLQAETVLCCRLDGRKEMVADARLVDVVVAKLEQVHAAMFSAAKKELDDHRVVAYSMDDFCKALDRRMLITAPFCGDKKCEEQIKAISARDAVVEEGAPSMGAKSLCIPFDQPDNLGDKCVNAHCSNGPRYFTMFGRSY